MPLFALCGTASPTPVDDARRFWDARFAQECFVDGDAPNDVLREQAQGLPPGDALCLAEGEGRNGVFLAELGHRVTVQDISPAGLAKAERLARQRGVTLTTRCSHLQHDTPAAGSADLVLAIWMHLPPALRAEVHCMALQELRSGGNLDPGGKRAGRSRRGLIAMVRVPWCTC